jgi:hypothetical protein
VLQVTTHLLLRQVPERPLLEHLQQQNLHSPEQEEQPNLEHRPWPIPKILTQAPLLLLQNPHHKGEPQVLLDNQVKMEPQVLLDNQVKQVLLDNQVKMEPQVLLDNQVKQVLLDNQVHLKLNLNLLQLDLQILKGGLNLRWDLLHLPTIHSMLKHRKP